jgi:hypothetical protein
VSAHPTLVSLEYFLVQLFDQQQLENINLNLFYHKPLLSLLRQVCFLKATATAFSHNLRILASPLGRN